MKLLTTLRRIFAVDTNEVPPFNPGRIHDMLSDLRAEAVYATRSGHNQQA